MKPILTISSQINTVMDTMGASFDIAIGTDIGSQLFGHVV